VEPAFENEVQRQRALLLQTQTRSNLPAVVVVRRRRCISSTTPLEALQVIVIRKGKRGVALQVAFERQIMKPVFSFDRL
jgi:hypothetical protein